MIKSELVSTFFFLCVCVCASLLALCPWLCLCLTLQRHSSAGTKKKEKKGTQKSITDLSFLFLQASLVFRVVTTASVVCGSIHRCQLVRIICCSLLFSYVHQTRLLLEGQGLVL